MKVSLVDVVNCLFVFVSVLEKACVAKDLDMEKNGHYTAQRAVVCSVSSY